PIDGEREVAHLNNLLQAQRAPERQRVADRARLLHRRDNRHRAQFAKRAGQRVNAFRPVAVVVGDKNASHASSIIVGGWWLVAELMPSRRPAGGTSARTSR